MPFIQVNPVEERTGEHRERLTKAITDSVVEILGVSKDAVWIEFHDRPKTRFATGGVLRSNE